MAKIPRANEVTKAIRSVGRELKLAIKEVNHAAGNRLARGDYEGAELLVDAAKSISQFANDVTVLQSKWRDVRRSKRGENSEKLGQTPLWEFYRPILRVLATLGGEASRKEIEVELERQVEGWLKDGDFVENARGVPRWKMMIRRARKPMIAEGFLSDENLMKWTITKKGEQVAKKENASK